MVLIEYSTGTNLCFDVVTIFNSPVPFYEYLEASTPTRLSVDRVKANGSVYARWVNVLQFRYVKLSSFFG